MVAPSAAVPARAIAVVVVVLVVGRPARDDAGGQASTEPGRAGPRWASRGQPAGRCRKDRDRRCRGAGRARPSTISGWRREILVDLDDAAPQVAAGGVACRPAASSAGRSSSPALCRRLGVVQVHLLERHPGGPGRRLSLGAALEDQDVDDDLGAGGRSACCPRAGARRRAGRPCWRCARARPGSPCPSSRCWSRRARCRRAAAG